MYGPTLLRLRFLTVAVARLGLEFGLGSELGAAFLRDYNDEAWVTVSTDELRYGVNERGFDLAWLNAALQQLGIGV